MNSHEMTISCSQFKFNNDALSLTSLTLTAYYSIHTYNNTLKSDSTSV